MNNSVETKDVGVMYKVGGEDILMSQDEYAHLTSIIDVNNTNWQNELEFNDGDYSTIVDALFTMHKVEDAWKVISDHKEDIDFKYIFNLDEKRPCPYFQLDRNAADVYKYIHDNNIIDDASYAYFQVLGGRLSDMDFWTKYLAGKSIPERLMAIHEAYNGISPFDMGLVVLSDDDKDIIFDGLDDTDVKLDEYIIGQYPGIFYDSETIVYLMISNKLEKTNFPRYFNILFKMYEIDKSDNLADAMNKLWNYVEITNTPIEEIAMDTLPVLDSFIYSNIFANYEDKDEFIDKILVNSLAFMNYPYRYVKLLKSVVAMDLTKHKVSATNLDPDKYPYVLSYKLLDIVDTSMFKIKYPFPAISNVIYNSDKHIIYKDGEFENAELKDSKIGKEMKELVDAYYTNGITDDELMKKCSSDDEYADLMSSYSSFLGE